MNRRNLLRLASLTAGVAALPPAAIADDGRALQKLTPEATQGPFWFDPGRLRADITEGRPGVPLGLHLTVQEADGRPTPNAVVDVWHCDAQGRYSGYDSQGGPNAGGMERRDVSAGSFLRGAQTTDAAGRVAFKTLYPGWYDGRAPHIHLKVMLAHDTVLTSQIFLPDALSEFIYANAPAYRRARLRDTLNSQDGIARSLGGFTAADLREEADRYRASMTVVVDRAARSTERFSPGPFPKSGGPRPEEPPPLGPRAQPLQGQARLDALIPGGVRG